MGEGTPLHGDRGAWNVVDHDTEHAKDINDAALTRHLPAPAAAGRAVRDTGTVWESTLTPTWGGIHTFPNVTLINLTQGSILFIGAAGAVTEDNTKLYFEDGNLAVGDNAGMRNVFQAVKAESTTDLNTVKALVVARNTNTTNNNWAGFSWQTEDAAGAIASGARVMTQFTSHAAGAVSGELVVDTRHAGTRAERLRANEDGIAVTGDVAVTGTVDGLDLSELGEMVFTADDGLLLLNSHGEINATEWWSQRKQKAIISGAFHQEAGRWPGTRGLVVEGGCTNYLNDPIFGYATIATNWTAWRGAVISRQAADYAIAGTHVARVVCDASQNEQGIFSGVNAGILGAKQNYSVRVRWVSGSGTIRVFAYRTDDAAQTSGEQAALNSSDGWHTLTVHVGAGWGTWQLYVGTTGSNTLTFDLDGCHGEKQSQEFCTSLCHGDAGIGCSWAGTAHNSISTRTSTEVNLDNQVGLISGKDTLTIATWVQMPFGAVAWTKSDNYIYEAKGADNNNRYIVSYDETTNTWKVYINGAVRLESSAQTFAAGDWIHHVITYDFTANSFKYYLNGALEDTDTTSLSAATLTDWCLGTNITGSNPGNLVFDGYALGCMLAAAEIAGLYALQRPLVDAGAIEGPTHNALRGSFDQLSGGGAIGGYKYWEGTVSGTGETTVIEDGAGDVVYGCQGSYTSTDRAGGAAQGNAGSVTPAAGSNTFTLFNVGGNTVVLRLYSTGKLTIDEFAGTGTIYVNLWLIWQ